MAQRRAGLVELWAGWSIELPNDCMVERDGTGAWAAWDDQHTIDVTIIEFRVSPDADIPVAELLDGRTPTHHGPGWVGVLSVVDEVVNGTAVVRALLTAAAPAAGTILSCSIGLLAGDQLPWAERVVGGLSQQSSS